jgi:hypothetical protein
VKTEQKKLPHFDVPFREIIQGNFLYADKTEYIHNLFYYSKFCYLTRPMGFGKTLLLDTLDELFRGNWELFDGLWISTSRKYKFVKHPVIRFSMAYINIL